jgi:hypothetical protein
MDNVATQVRMESMEDCDSRGARKVKVVTKKYRFMADYKRTQVESRRIHSERVIMPLRLHHGKI